MTAPLSPHHPITGSVVLKSAQSMAVSCPWCQRIMRVCDGTLTLAEIAQKIHLPLKVCEKLVMKAVQEHWLEVIAPADHASLTAPETAGPIDGNFWFEVNQAIQVSLGNAGVRLLQEAALMTRLGAGEITRQEAGHFLIALELAATEHERLQLSGTLDDLRTRYAA